MNEAERWTELIEEFKKSGKSQRVWCSEKEIKRSSLRYWLERLDELTDGDKVIFAEVVICGDEKC